MIYSIVPAAPGTVAHFPQGQQRPPVRVVAYGISWNVVTETAEVTPIAVNGAVQGHAYIVEGHVRPLA
jgi:hypothetical protein